MGLIASSLGAICSSGALDNLNILTVFGEGLLRNGVRAYSWTYGREWNARCARTQRPSGLAANIASNWKTFDSPKIRRGHNLLFALYFCVFHMYFKCTWMFLQHCVTRSRWASGRAEIRGVNTWCTLPQTSAKNLRRSQVYSCTPQAKKLGFAWFYSSESGLFNGLRPKKIKKSFPVSGPARNVSIRFHALLMRRRARGRHPPVGRQLGNT